MGLGTKPILRATLMDRKDLNLPLYTLWSEGRHRERQTEKNVNKK